MMETIRILLIGDVVGKPGRRAIAERLPDFRRGKGVSFCVANIENSAGGSGSTPDCVQEIGGAGVDVMTSGDHVWKKKEIIPLMEKDPRLLRPANLPPLAAGRGWGVYAVHDGPPVAVVNLQGRVFMKPVDCPLRAADAVLREIPPEVRVIVVDFHAEATAEKVALGWYLDGRVSCVFGTHTHIQTADEAVLPGGTAYITDLGMTGPYDSVIGRRKDRVIGTMISQMPSAFDVAKGDVRLSGALVEIDARTGRARAIERVQLREEAPS